MNFARPSADRHTDPTRPVRLWLQYAGVLAFAVIMLAVVLQRRDSDLADARSLFLSETAVKTQAAKNSAENGFNQIYRGLRTIARLPGIQNIARHAENLTADGKTTLQELYNNLADTVAVSAVYVVPVGFDPDTIDPVTTKPQEPILVFDNLIVGRTADWSTAVDLSSVEIEEIKIHEYRQLKRQLEIMNAGYPTRASFKALDNPAISGPEVVTRDNRYFSPTHPDDADRSGIAYSVPFYGADGRLRGVISAIVLTSRLRALIPADGFELANKSNKFSTLSAWRAKRNEHVQIDQVPLITKDMSGGWSLEVARDEAAFLGRGDVRAAEYMTVAGLVFTFALTGVLLCAVRTYWRTHRRAAARQRKLDNLVRERTVDLETERQKFRDFAETTSDWFWETNNRLDIENVSDNFVQATGISKESFLGQNLLQLEPSDQHGRMADEWRPQLTGRIDLRNMYVMLQSPTRGRVYLRFAGRAVENEAGKFIGYRGTAADITDGLVRARAANQGQKLQALGTMAAGLAHEFNNILAIVLGYTESLRTEYGRDENALAQLDQIAEAGRRGAGLSKSLLSFGRSSRARAGETFNVRALVGELPQLLKPLLGPGYSLDVVSADIPLWVNGDRDLLLQSIVNLVVNARDAMPKGGTIALSLGAEPPGSDRLQRAGLPAGREFVAISVSDTGEGMDSETLRRIFDPFFTTKKVGKGTGLGLSLLFSFVKDLQGHVDVESVPDYSTSFIILLPLSAPPVSHASVSAGAAAVDFTGLRVLLVDDEPQLVSVFERMLRGLGFDVVAHSDVDVALGVLDDDREKIDVIVSDVLMPQMSGFHFAGLARSLRQSIDVLFVTGQPERGGEDADPAPKGAKILRKPFDRNQLSDALAELLRAKAAA